MKTSKIIRIILTIIISSAPLFAADILIKQKVHADAFTIMGQEQPATDMIQSIWITDNGFSTIDEKTTEIILLNKKIMYKIDHAKKTYVEIPFDFDKLIESAAGEKNMSEETKNMMKNMMKIEFTVTPTNDKKKINGWNCTKYIQKMTTMMGSIDIEVWASQDIKIDKNIYKKYSTSLFSTMPGMQKNMAAINKELKKIKGITVKSISTMNMMGTSINTWTEILEYKEGKAPASAFEVPAGYTKAEASMY